ncbi:MAG: hypothetical protein R6U41_04120 [Desulfosalsimonas sp.]|uniref:hypothetical protein n=1 Tax=Desulfosalsimonas sp. TaxID=3073848 RepID=UPI0039704BCE
MFAWFHAPNPLRVGVLAPSVFFNRRNLNDRTVIKGPLPRAGLAEVLLADLAQGKQGLPEAHSRADGALTPFSGRLSVLPQLTTTALSESIRRSFVCTFTFLPVK